MLVNSTSLCERYRGELVHFIHPSIVASSVLLMASAVIVHWFIVPSISSCLAKSQDRKGPLLGKGWTLTTLATLSLYVGVNLVHYSRGRVYMHGDVHRVSGRKAVHVRFGERYFVVVPSVASHFPPLTCYLSICMHLYGALYTCTLLFTAHKKQLKEAETLY